MIFDERKISMFRYIYYERKISMFNDIDRIYIMKERYQCLMILIQYIL